MYINIIYRDIKYNIFHQGVFYKYRFCTRKRMYITQ